MALLCPTIALSGFAPVVPMPAPQVAVRSSAVSMSVELM
jgi:hypothetical protein